MAVSHRCCRKMAKECTKKVCYTCKVVVLPTNPIVVFLFACLFVCLFFLCFRCRYVVGSLSSYLFWTLGGKGGFFLLTHLPKSLLPQVKKGHLIAGLSNRRHVFIPCLDCGKYSGFGQKMSKERLCLKKT